MLSKGRYAKDRQSLRLNPLFFLSFFFLFKILSITAFKSVQPVLQGFKVLLSFLPLGLESKVTFARDIFYEQLREYD